MNVCCINKTWKRFRVLADLDYGLKSEEYFYKKKQDVVNYLSFFFAITAAEKAYSLVNKTSTQKQATLKLA